MIYQKYLDIGDIFITEPLEEELETLAMLLDKLQLHKLLEEILKETLPDRPSHTIVDKDLLEPYQFRSFRPSLFAFTHYLFFILVLTSFLNNNNKLPLPQLFQTQLNNQQ